MHAAQRARRARGRRDALATARRSGRARRCAGRVSPTAVEIRVQDYRDIVDGPFDAISSIGMFEHVGAAKLDEYFTRLFALLRPGGAAPEPRHRASARARVPAFAHRGFIDRYVFPDGELHEVGSVVTRVQRAGFEVAQRRGSARALRARRCGTGSRTSRAHWDEAVRLVGPGRARVWRLYMAASAINFDAERTHIHQVLAVRNHPDGTSAMPRRPDWEPPT